MNSPELRSDMPKQERSIATRATILRAAAEAFIAHGYADATLAKITKNSSFTNGALYHHFPTREALAIAVVEEYEQRSWQVVLNANESNDDPLVTILAIAMDFARLLQTDRLVLAGVILTTEVGAPVALRRPYQGWVDALERLVVEGQDLNLIRDDLPAREISEYMVAVFTGLQLISKASSERADLSERLRTGWTFLLNGLAVEGTTPPVDTLMKSVRRGGSASAGNEFAGTSSA